MSNDLQSPALLAAPYDLRDLPGLAGLDTSSARAREQHPAGTRLSRPTRARLTLLDAHRAVQTEGHGRHPDKSPRADHDGRPADPPRRASPPPPAA